uniref:OSJNBb0046P18.4 protein n=1 Tax=Oryza sativa subsp. japonica TaxID=39947 RepID=Q7XQ56_ORYSJ|nr:OSJNBb0046P18.4 [Oryza sativa Japonica Group]
MANKSLREFAAPSADNVAIGPHINMGDVDFDLKSSLITMAINALRHSSRNSSRWAKPMPFVEGFQFPADKGRVYSGSMGTTAGSEERLQTRQRGVHTVKETELLAAKLDHLMKRLDDHEKRLQCTVKALDSHVTCEVCGGTGHSGNDCRKTREEAMYMGNNGYRPQGGKGWNQPRPYYQGGNNNGNFSNQPSLKDLVFAQAKTTDALSKKLAANDNILKNINVKLDGFASAFQNQLSFNKMIESQLAQLASLVPANETRRIPGQPDSSIENVMAITTRGEDPHQRAVVGRYASANIRPLSQGHTQQQETAPNNGGGQADGSMQQRNTPQAPEKEEGSGVSYDHLLDRGTTVRPSLVRPWSQCQRHAKRRLRQDQLQMADSSVRYPAGIAEDVLVKIWDFFILVDFVVLDMDMGKETPLIPGRPFLSTAGAYIDVGTGSISFHINGKEEKFEFQPRTEQCSVVKIKYGPKPQNIQVVEVEPPKTDSLVKFMQNFLEKETTMPRC